MPALTTVSEVYLGMTGATVTMGGYSAPVIDGKYTVESMVDDMSNNTSGGWSEDVACLKKASGDMTIAYKSATPPLFVEGTIYPLVISIPSGPYLSGNVRVTKRDYPGVDVKKGVKVGISWTGQGVIYAT